MAESLTTVPPVSTVDSDCTTQAVDIESNAVQKIGALYGRAPGQTPQRWNLQQ